MKKRKNILTISLVGLLAISLVYATTLLAQRNNNNNEDGMRFIMVMEAPERDPVEFSGISYMDDYKLTGIIGGIETVTLFTDGSLYTLTPAIKTAREIDNPDPPAIDEDGWSEWLIEPGRVSPFSFAELIGLEDDFDGETSIGDAETIVLQFTDGRLDSIRFPVGDGDGRITYAYSDFESDPDLTGEDVSIPEDYRISD